MPATHETRFLLTAKDKTKVAFKGVKGNLKSVGGAVTGLHSQLLALAGIGGLGAMITGIINTNREIETLKSSLKSVTGSADEANRAFKQIQEFAKTTPFDLNQVTRGFIQLKALGLDPSEAAMRSYGNTASAMGKSMNQMIEAVADAATGEFERLKEFGIKASKQKDEVSFTFQGITTTIKNNSEEITKYLQGIGNNQFGTAMADQMNNLAPAFSNMNQAFSDLSVKIGESGLNDLVRDLAVSTTDFVNSFDDKKLRSVGIELGAIAAGLNAIWDATGGGFMDAVGSAMEAIAGLEMPGGELGGGLPGYKLGDFNNASDKNLNNEIGRRKDYESLRKEMEAKYGGNKNRRPVAIDSGVVEQVKFIAPVSERDMLKRVDPKSLKGFESLIGDFGKGGTGDDEQKKTNILLKQISGILEKERQEIEAAVAG